MEKELTKFKKIYAILKLLVFASFIAGSIVLVYLNREQIFVIFKSPEKIEEIIQAHPGASKLIYLGLMLVQIIVSFIPSQAVQIAGGYVFGFFITVLLSAIGCIIGEFVTFYMARLLGRDAMYVIFGEEKFSKYVDLFNSERGYTILALFYLIPMLPKDILAFAVGISKMRLSIFIFIATVFRMPCVMGSIGIGVALKYNLYGFGVFLAFIGILFALLGIWQRKRIMEICHNWYVRFAKSGSEK